MYWIIHYTDTLLNGKELGWDVVREEATNLIALFTKKVVAEREADNLITESRATQVIPLELSYVDRNYFIIVDK